MRPPFSAPVARLAHVLAEEKDAVAAPRPRGSRRPHTGAKVAAVRRLIEETPLTYGEIARRTGVGRASICRWARDGGWTRHAFAPRATDTVPTARASAKLRRRQLSARLLALAERHIRELEAAACVDAEKLGQALELMKMAKLASQGRRRRRSLAGPFGEPREHALREHLRPMAELLVAGVDVHRAPRAAIDDFLENRATPPEEDKPPRHGRRRFTSEERHRWMKEKM